jgi:hypothetical protein
MTKWSMAEFEASGGLGTVEPGEPDDLFVICASYEPRCSAIASRLSRGYRSRRAVVYFNREFCEGDTGAGVRGSVLDLKRLLEPHCDQVLTAEGSWLDPAAQLDALRDALTPDASSCGSRVKATVDTTTFNREALIVAVALLRMRHPQCTIRALYTSPLDHGEWLSRGYRAIRNITGFSGVQVASRPTLLAILSGFESERTAKLVDEHEPAKVLLGIGDPPTSDRFLKRNEAEQELTFARQTVEQFRFPADTIDGCRRVLGPIVDRHLRTHNIVLAPMSTKLSTLAAFVVAEQHPEVQLTYCVPGEYNTTGYSTGIGEIFVDAVPTPEDA